MGMLIAMEPGDRYRVRTTKPMAMRKPVGKTDDHTQGACDDRLNLVP